MLLYIYTANISIADTLKSLWNRGMDYGHINPVYNR